MNKTHKIFQFSLITLILFVLLTQDSANLNAQVDLIDTEITITLDKGDNKQWPHFNISPGFHGEDIQSMDLSGFDVGDSFSKMSLKKIRETVDIAFKAKYNIVYLRIDWESIEPHEKDLTRGDLDKIKEFLNEISIRNSSSEDGHQVRVIIALELDRPPEWYRDSNPTGVMINMNLAREISGPMGPVKNPEDNSLSLDYGILNHPEFQAALETVVNNIVYYFKDHPALFGWALTSPSSPFMYPGAGKNGIGGFTDYSWYSCEQFTNKYEIDKPLPYDRESQGAPDLRPEWLAWDRFRRDARRKAIDDLGNKIASNDLKHPIFVLFWGVMAYEGDNGYRSQVWGNDYYHQLTQQYVNGVLIPFQLSSKTFKYPSGRDDMDSLHQLCSSIDMAQRHGKVPVMMVEKSWRDPPTIKDIDDLAHLVVALGVDIIWSSNGMSQLSLPWSTAEQAAIERTAHLNNLPMPSLKQKIQVGVLDYPFELSKFYCEKDKELEQSLAVLDALQDAGFNFIAVTPEEIMPQKNEDNPEESLETEDWVDDIVFVAPIAWSMAEYLLESENDFFHDRVSQFFTRLREDGKYPFMLQKPQIDAFIWNNYDEYQLRREIKEEFKKKGVKYHDFVNNKCFIIVNWPYVFIKVNERNSDDLKIILEQYSSQLNYIKFFDVYNHRDLQRENILKCNHALGILEFILPDDKRDTFLLAWDQRLLDHVQTISDHRRTIDQMHRIKTMKQSLPVALVLTVVVITLGVIYTVQLYHPTVAKKRKKRRRPPPVLHDHEDYFTDD